MYNIRTKISVIFLLALIVPYVLVYAEQPTEPVINTEEHVTTTVDSWDISIRRYLLKDIDKKDIKAAVILCHGFNFNNIFWDIDKEASLSRYLAKNGYDVWVPSLRGSGASSKPILSTLKDINRLNPVTLAQGLIKVPFDITKVNWTIDDHITKDAPAIIKYVKERSGFDKVYWVGHSMGGIIIFGYLEIEGQDDIAGFIPIGSMVVIPQPLTPQFKMIAAQERITRASLIFNTKVAADIRAFTFGAVKYPIEELLLKRENMSDKVLFRLFRECIEDTSFGVVEQFTHSIKSGRMVSSPSSDFEYDYTANINRINVPVLIMAGSEDAFVTKKVLKECYRRLSSFDKKLVIFSKKKGYSAEYGHSDLLIGKNSEKEVYPVILNWLDKRSSRLSAKDVSDKVFSGIVRLVKFLGKPIKFLSERIRDLIPF